MRNMRDEKATDRAYQDVTLAEVREEATGWDVKRSDGWSFCIPKREGIVPKVGSRCRFYGRGVGFPVRAVDVDGQEVYYRTAAEDDLRHRTEQAARDADRRCEFRAKEAEHDAIIAALPEVFRHRLAHFQATPDWGWQYEAYELSCCVDAVKIAAACRREDFGALLKQHGVRIVLADNTPATAAWDDTPLNRLRAFEAINSDANGYNYTLQAEVLPGLFDGHSGNSFSMAVRLAYHDLTEPENVYREHGALTPLVGCDDYGCRHPR